MKTFFQITIYLTILILKATSEEKATNTISVSSGASAGQSSTIQKLIKILEKYGLEEQRGLKRVYLSNRSITCNDGSKSGFYLRKSHGSKRWIIFLEGGWYCYDQKTCRNRWLRLRHLMTSTQWPDTRDVGGLLSGNPEENPFWWNANHVFVPYCTSDTWSGTRASSHDMFSFMGAEIVSQVVKDLIPLGLENASSLLLAGSSAGGTGVMLNLDRVQNLVHHQLGLKDIAIRGVSDSGWFLDRVPYSPNGLTPVDAVRKGMQLWKGQMPENCRLRHPEEPWRCYFGYRLYPTLRAPLFVFQWLFDEAQMSADNVGAPVTKQQWDYIHKMGDSLRQTFENVSAVFAPSCISHSVLTKKDWQLVKVDDVSLAQALHCWQQMPVGSQRNDDSLIRTNQPCGKPLKKLLRSGPTKGNNTQHDYTTSSANAVLTERPAQITNQLQKPTISTRPRGRDKKRQRNGRRHKARRVLERKKDGKDRKVKHERKKSQGRRRGNKEENAKSTNHTNLSNGIRPERSVVSSSSPSPSPSPSSRKRKCTQGACHFRFIERCSWPQCNHSCPKLHNPFTGEEMDFIELLKSFGLDMKSVANALGIDIQTLNTMDHDELLNLLTQRAN